MHGHPNLLEYKMGKSKMLGNPLRQSRTPASGKTAPTPRRARGAIPQGGNNPAPLADPADPGGQIQTGPNTMGGGLSTINRENISLVVFSSKKTGKTGGNNKIGPTGRGG